VVQENPILKGFPAFDLAQIEVARGPQGTLFGRNTPAGVVKFESVKPGRKLEGYGSLGIGTLGTTNLEGAATIPLSPTVSMRASRCSISAAATGWTTTSTPAPRRSSRATATVPCALQLLVAPGKDFSALFNLHARDLDGSARLFRANIIEPGSNDLVAGFDATRSPSMARTSPSSRPWAPTPG
jgi:iron complex outermembrane receptor protein